MLLTFGRNAFVSCRWCWHLWLFMRTLLLLSVAATFYEGDPCSMKSINGVCTAASKCETLPPLIESGDFKVDEVISCGFILREELICCPTKLSLSTNTTTNTTTTTTTTTTVLKIPAPTALTTKIETTRNSTTPSTPTPIPWYPIFTFDPINPLGFAVNATPPTIPVARPISVKPTVSTTATNPIPLTTTSERTKPMIERPALRACKELDEGLEPLLGPEILNGTPVELGEFPHMVAIGFTQIGNDIGPYDFRCGGSLIDKRFILTAAHCVSERHIQPAIVRMGVTDFTDEEQMRQAVEIRVETLHVHPNYTIRSTYNDIALLELERDVEYSTTVYPGCLYSEPEDPPSTFQLYAIGWGTINTKSRETSSQLLKARLQVLSVSSCNQSYALEGPTRKLSQGVIYGQLCAFDPGLTMDACQGDSGGPLNLVLDATIKKYRIVGIISAGFSCGTRTPSLYTRVSFYLDYIESVVWPGNK